MEQQKKHLPEGSEEYFLGDKKRLLEQDFLMEKARFQGFLSGIFIGVFGVLLLTVIFSKVFF